MSTGVERQSSYRHGKAKPCTNDYIRPVVLRICRECGARRILDIGCGNGTLCRNLADAGFAVVGMEPTSSGVACARERVPEGTFYEKGVYDDPADIPEDSFDMVVSTEVVEHLFKPSALPAFAFAKLNEGGLLVVSTPYHGYLKNLALALVNGWDRHHSPLWTGGHIKFWSRRSLTSLLETNGFRVLAFHGVGRCRWLWNSMVLVACKEGGSKE